MASTYSPDQILTFLFDGMACILYAVSSVASLSMKMHDTFLLCFSPAFSVSPPPTHVIDDTNTSEGQFYFLLAFFISPKALLKKYIPLPFIYFYSLFPGLSFSDYLQHFIVKCIVIEMIKFA